MTAVSGTTLNGEANLTFDGSTLDIKGNTDGNVQAILTRGNDQGFRIQAVNESSGNNVGNDQGKFGLFYSDGSDISGFRFQRGAGTGGGSLTFTTGGTERLKIASDGKFYFGNQSNLDPAINNAVGLSGSGVLGFLSVCRDSDVPFVVGRTGSDGNLIRFYHAGNQDGVLNTSSGGLSLHVNNNFTLQTSGQNSLYAAAGGKTSLYMNGTERLETTNTGINISGSYCNFTGAMGSTENFKISNTTSGGYIQIGLQQQDSDGLHHRAYIKAYKGGASIAGKLELLARGSGGGTNRGLFIDAANYIESSLTFIPTADNAYDLGSSSRRWQNVYTTDLQLSNKGKRNDVDGTWGDYTIQEGENDLFLINNRSGKKYKFNLTEVS